MKHYFKFETEETHWTHEELKQYLQRASIVIDGIIYFSMNVISDNFFCISTRREISPDFKKNISVYEINRDTYYWSGWDEKPTASRNANVVIRIEKAQIGVVA